MSLREAGKEGGGEMLYCIHFWGMERIYMDDTWAILLPTMWM